MNNNSNNGFGILVKYHRKKKRISQVSLAGDVGIDNSIISRIENGEFIPSKTTVEGIANYLRLNQSDKEELNSAFMQAILRREGLDNQRIFLNDNEAIQFAEEFISNIRTLRIQGMPKLAVAESEQKIDLLSIIGERSLNKNTRQQIFLLYSQLLMEVSKSYMDFLPPEEVWPYMTPLIERQKRAANETRDPTSIMMSRISEESALYVCKDYYLAHQIGKELYSNLNFLDKNWHSEILRATAINAGYLNNESELEQLEEDVTLFVQKDGYSDPMNTSFVLEGLARAQSSINSINVMGTIEKAWNYIELGKKTGKHSALRTVQLIRTQLKAMIETGDNSYVDFERLARKGLMLSEELGYTRYEKEITGLMDLNLNNPREI